MKNNVKMERKFKSELNEQEIKEAISYEYYLNNKRNECIKFETKYDFGKCKICSDDATGIHYGVGTCEGCKVKLCIK